MIIINNTDGTGALQLAHTLRDRPNGGVCAGGSGEMERMQEQRLHTGAWQCICWT